MKRHLFHGQWCNWQVLNASTSETTLFLTLSLLHNWAYEMKSALKVCFHYKSALLTCTGSLSLSKHSLLKFSLFSTNHTQMIISVHSGNWSHAGTNGILKIPRKNSEANASFFSELKTYLLDTTNIVMSVALTNIQLHSIELTNFQTNFQVCSRWHHWRCIRYEYMYRNDANDNTNTHTNDHTKINDKCAKPTEKSCANETFHVTCSTAVRYKYP